MGATEEAFDREAARVIGWTARSPFSPGPPSVMRQTWAPGEVRLEPGAGRPTLEPTEWGQTKLQALPCGNFAQCVEQGPQARMFTRGGADCSFAPDESDGISAAGKRTARVFGSRSVSHSDLGLLRTSDRGQAALHKTSLGASSAAPMQDHYSYQTGPAVTNAEFPLGKRLYCQDPSVGYGQP